MTRPRNIVVTGALGHIGSAFIRGLKPDEFGNVVLVDDMSAQRYSSLFDLPAGVRFSFVEADVDKADLAALFAGADVVVHLAAITDAAGSFTRAEDVERVNFGVTRKVAEACRAAGAKLIFPSTTSVYGVQTGLVDETCPAEQLKPQSPYADAKLKSERHLADADGPDFVIIRMGTIFGVSPGMRFHTAVNKFVWQACLGRPLTVWRTALDQKRPYLAVGDAVRALRFIIARDLFDSGIYNIVTVNATVREIVEHIRTVVPAVRIELVDAAIMNQLSYEVSSDKSRR
ncbi:MAG TPA: SDR family oxidoreductase, partial [Rhizomicrobium sp.]